MADLKSLIRVKRHNVEQKQKRLAELYRKAEELDGEKAQLLETMEAEHQRMQEDGNVHMLEYYGRYSENVGKRVEDLEEQRERLSVRIEAARADMARAFEDLKKVEITQERREEEEQKELDKKEADELDEIAIEGYRRKVAEEEG